MYSQELTKEQQERIRQILKERGYTVLGIGSLNGKTVIGAKLTDHKKVVKEIQKAIKDELGIDTKINL